jgi:hypothetical protein
VRTIFTLASGRSSTRFLYEIITRNALDCVATHEPYVSNPSMFGPAVYAHAAGDKAYLRTLLERKRRAIMRHAPKTYVETRHAFLKSWFDLAPEFFPNIGAVHLVRHPFKVAKSFVNRENFLRKYRVPFTHYRAADGNRYFYWSLTGIEPIFRCFDVSRLSRFQWYLLEWIEVENRVAQFLDLIGSRGTCVHLRVPEDINDPVRLRQMLDRLELRSRAYEIDLSGFKNATPGAPTVITDRDFQEAAELLEGLPSEYLEVFRTAPYVNCEWTSLLLGEESKATPLRAVRMQHCSKAVNT